MDEKEGIKWKMEKYGERMKKYWEGKRYEILK